MDTALWKSLTNQGLETLFEIYGASELAGVGLRRHWDAPFELLDCWHGRSVCGDRLLLHDGSHSPALPDHLDFQSNRTFHLCGRKDLKVQVAGINVSTEAIASRLLAHPSIVDCQVRLMRPSEGDRLKALVVTAQPVTDHTRTAIRTWCTNHFLPHERPQLTFATELARNAMGKAVDWHHAM